MTRAVHGSFAEHMDAWGVVNTGKVATIGHEIPTSGHLSNAFHARATELGMNVRRSQGRGATSQELQVERDGELLHVKRASAYAMPLANHEDPVAAVRAIAEHIHAKHGAGTVWIDGRATYLAPGWFYRENPNAQPVYARGREIPNPGGGYRTEIDPKSYDRRVRVGAYYVHEAMLPAKETTTP